MNIFDRRLVRRHRDRAAAEFSMHDFLFREAAHRLADRLDDVTRKFPLALDLGCHGGELVADDGGGHRGSGGRKLPLFLVYAPSPSSLRHSLAKN